MNELELLKAQVQELLEWKKQRETQQIAYPLDIASKTALGAPYGEGAGSTTKTQSVAVSVSGDPETVNVTVPAAYVQTFILVVNGVRYEIPSLI